MGRLSSMKPKYYYFNARIPASIDRNSLSEQEATLLAYMVWKMQNSDNFAQFKWLPIPKDSFVNLFGARYSAIVQQCINKGYIEVYTTEGGATYSKKRGICKHYRFTPEHQNHYYKGCFTKEVAKLASVNFDSKEEPKLPSVDIGQDYKGLRLLDEWQDALYGPSENAEFLFGCRIYANQIGKGRITVKHGNTGRIYHPVILMSKKLRPFLRIHGETVHYIDVTACHPYLLAHFANKQERGPWLELCENDFYAPLVTDSWSRETIKEHFQKAISYSPQGRGPIATHILNHIKKHSPSIFAWLEAQWLTCENEGKEGNTPQYLLQKLESSIFVEAVYNKHRESMWMLPMHDGIAVEKENLDKAEEAVQQAALEILGYNLKTTKV